jgi:hypothetical protein
MSEAISTIRQDQTRTLLLDAEHAGIRLALPLLTVVGFAVGLAVATAVSKALNLSSVTGCLSFGFAVGLALLSAVFGDRVLKQRWPSGRSLALSPDGLRLRDTRKNRQNEAYLAWGKHFNLLAWRFAVQRGSARVPKGWLMLGLQLIQDEVQLTLYTFMPAREAGALNGFGMFVPLTTRAAIEKGDLSLREMSEQRRLLKAEDERWRDGGEVRREDFPALWEEINAHLQGWQKRAD